MNHHRWLPGVIPVDQKITKSEISYPPQRSTSIPQTTHLTTIVTGKRIITFSKPFPLYLSPRSKSNKWNVNETLSTS